MSHDPSHLLRRGSAYIYNRRVPERAREGFGRTQVRVSLGSDRAKAKIIAERLSAKLEAIWSAPQPIPMDLGKLVQGLEPRKLTLDDALGRYLNDRGPGKGANFERDTRLALNLMMTVAGNKSVEDYDRTDARAFMDALRRKGLKTASIRRRMNTVKAVLEFAYLEGDLDQRNPFSKLRVPGEGLDAKKRGTFTQEQLQGLYAEALASGSEVALLAPLLGETGARLAEVVGLRWEDVILDHEAPHILIRPNEGRRLKTRGSERKVPLVGSALQAMKLLHSCAESQEGWLYPRYEKDRLIRATHASNTINKWIGRRCPGLTAHCFRHTMRDRLRAVHAPMDMIDQIGGWSAGRSIGAMYGNGYSIASMFRFLDDVSLRC